MGYLGPVTYECLLRAQIMQERQLRYDSEFPIDVGFSKILYCQKLCSLHPGDVFLRHRAGNMFCKEGNYTEASDWFDVSIEHDPENSTVSRVDDIRHYHAVCDNCEYPLIGRRYRCICCDDFDLCRDCFTAPIRLQHSPGSTHEFVKIPSDKWVEKMIESGKLKANHQGKANNDGNANTQLKGSLIGDREVI